VSGSDWTFLRMSDVFLILPLGLKVVSEVPTDLAAGPSVDTVR